MYKKYIFACVFIFIQPCPSVPSLRTCCADTMNRHPFPGGSVLPPDPTMDSIRHYMHLQNHTWEWPWVGGVILPYGDSWTNWRCQSNRCRSPGAWVFILFNYTYKYIFAYRKAYGKLICSKSGFPQLILNIYDHLSQCASIYIYIYISR